MELRIKNITDRTKICESVLLGHSRKEEITIKSIGAGATYKIIRGIVLANQKVYNGYFSLTVVEEFDERRYGGKYISQLEKEYNIPKAAIVYRMKNGWVLDDALKTTPEDYEYVEDRDLEASILKFKVKFNEYS